MMPLHVFYKGLAIAILLSCQSNSKQPSLSQNVPVMKIESSVFKQGEIIPSKYSCQGDDINPPISISAIPSNSKSLALIMDDPDAPGGTWVHWVLWNILPGTN